MTKPSAVALSRAGALAEGLMEAGWLVVAACLPAALQGADLDLYESPKVWLLHVCATVMLGAALIKIAEGGWRSAWRGQRVAILALGAALLYAVWSATSTLFALAPIPGLFGIPSRGQGVVTDLAYVTVFVVLATFLRDREQLRRLVAALVLGSVPVCALGLVETAGFAPFPPFDPWVAELPVRSTLGQHSFLAAYLLLVIPLTAARWLETLTPPPDEHAAGDAGTALRSSAWLAGPLALWAIVLWVAVSWWGAAWWAMPPVLMTIPIGLLLSPRPPRRMQQFAFAGLLLAQLVVLAASQGRGPWIGFFLASFLALALGLMFARSWRRLLWPALALYCASLLLVIVLNVPQGPLAPVKRWHPLLARVGSMSETKRSDPGGVRLSIWRSVPRLFTARPGAPSYVSPARLVSGYGRDSQLNVFPAALDEYLRRGSQVDTTGRRHQITVDRAHNDLLDHLITLGVVGLGLFLCIWVALGLVAIRLLRRPAERLYGGALTVALLAHGIELQTGVAITATRALFWLEAGMLVAMLGMAHATASPAALTPRRSGHRAGRAPSVVIGLGAVAIALIAPAIVSDPVVLMFAMTTTVLGGLACIALPCSADRTVARRAPVWLISASVAVAILAVAVTGANFVGAVYANQGREYALKGGWLQAASHYEQAVRLAPWQATSWVSLGAVYLSARGREAARSDTRVLLARAQDALETAVRLNPADARTRRALAGLYVQAGAVLAPDALWRAERLLDEAFALETPTAQALAERAELALHRGMPADAARFADSAIAVDPTRWIPYAVRARAALDLKRGEEARRFVGEAQARVPPQDRARLDRYLQGDR